MTRNPPLADVHEAAGARTTEFGGWEMPVRFTSIGDEHEAVRCGAGIFDVSHLSRITVDGPDAGTLTDRLTTNDVTALDPGDAQYACICREDGVILDDTVVYRLGEDAVGMSAGAYLFVPNAGKDDAMVERWREHADQFDLEATVESHTAGQAMLAVQGPDAPGLVDDAGSEEMDSLLDVDRWRSRSATIHGVECLAARTGYTGEDGFELVCDAADAAALWSGFVEEQAVTSCGLGARDTLRLEAGLLLSGQDFDPDDEPRTPYEAGLTFALAMDAGGFVGRDALADAGDPPERLVGLELDDRAVPRHGYEILADGDDATTRPADGGEPVGHVTSGTISPCFDVPIALGYVDREFAAEGTELAVAIRDRTVDATVVDRRFLARHGDGSI
jgi:aminomethyltransferase